MFASNKIIEIQSFDSLIKKNQDFNKDDLFIFDIDGVLIKPKDVVLRKSFMEFVQSLMSSGIRLKSKKDLEVFFSKLRLQAKMEIIDKNSLVLIKKLENSKVKVIALSGGRYLGDTGAFGVIPSLEDLRLKETKELNIEFSNTFSSNNFIDFLDNKEFIQTQKPIFKNGILFSGRLPKGKVLIEFLKYLHWIPKRIFFIDDRLENLESVQTELQNIQIEFYGFKYNDPSLDLENVNQQIVELQKSHLLEKEEWLSDEVAKQLLTTNKGNNESSI